MADTRTTPAGDFVVSIEGLDALQDYIAELPAQTQKAADLATIDATRFAFRESSKAIRSQVRLSPEYIGNAERGGNRLTIKYDQQGDVRIGVVEGVKRAVSLSRFLTSGPVFGGKTPARIRVKPNGRTTTTIKVTGGDRSEAPMFAVRLSRGKSLTEDSFNVGLAVRLRPGEQAVARKEDLTPLSPNVYLLYGPSVNQVFYDVAPAISDSVAGNLQDSFLRQFARLTKD